MGVPAAGDAMSENLRDHSNLEDSQSDSLNLYSGIAVIDGKSGRRPDAKNKTKKDR
jgi:hypothetical protein